MRWMGAAWLGAVAVGASACLVSTSGLSGGVEPSSTEAGAATDGGPSSVDAAAGATADGEADAGGPFCAGLAPKPAFCADFDESTKLGAGWTEVLAGARGAQTIDGATFTSAGHSLATRLPAGTTSTSYSASLGASLQAATPDQGDHVSLDLDLRLEAGDPNLGAQVATVYFGGAAASYAIHLLVTESGLGLQEDINPAHGSAQYPSVAIPGALPLNAWTHATIDARFSTSTITITVGDAAPFVHAMASGASNGTVTIEVGAVYYATAAKVAATSLHQDNVVLRVE